MPRRALALAGIAAAAADLASTPLNQYPMIMTHDAGTSYLSGGTCSILHPVNDWTQTQQSGPFSKQLDCGARALDLRMYVDNGHLVMHHGPIAIEEDFSAALEDVKGWAAKHPDELVLLYSSHCDGKSDTDKSSCLPKVHDAMKKAGIADLDCSTLGGLTVGAALEKGKLSSGGSVIALVGCGVEENYDPSIKCYGDLLGKEEEASPSKAVNASLPNAIYWCYGHGSDKAFNNLWSYMSKLTDTDAVPHQGENTLWMAQAHWQSDASAVTQGTLHGSCLLLDESRAQVIAKLTDKIKSGSFKHINLLEVNNVCDGGNELLAALRARSAVHSDILL